MKLIIFILSVLFPFIFAVRNYYQWRELSSVAKYTSHKFSRKWHYWQAAVQVLFFITIGFTQNSFLHGLFAALMSMFIFWFVFDISFNKLTGKPFYYTSNSGIDRIIGKTGKVGVIVIKLIPLVIFTTWHFKNIFR